MVIQLKGITKLKVFALSLWKKSSWGLTYFDQFYIDLMRPPVSSLREQNDDKFKASLRISSNQ